jgi:intein/homing endonuclease
MVKAVVEEISGNGFEEKTKKGIFVVDFYAEWCLSPETKLIFNPCVKNIESAEKGLKVLSFDKNFRESFAEIKSTNRVLANKKVKIITERGREIICTPEHLILTNKGFKKAEKLSKKDLVSVYAFSSYPAIGNNSRFFLTEKKIRATAKKLGLGKESYISELKEKNLLNIKYNDEKAYILASLLGFLLTDGSLSMTKNNQRLVEFFAEEKDKEELMNDLKFLGFDSNSRQQKIEGEISNRKFIQKITRIRVSKSSLFILMVSLGGIIGRKFIEGLDIPKWVTNGPKEIQRAFLQGFLGGDGSRLTIDTIKRKKWKAYSKPNINPIEFHFYANAKNKPKKFAERFSKLLNNFGVSVRKIEIREEDRYKRKDGKISILLKIYLNSSIKSAYSYASIGFKYSYNKKLTSSLSREYLMGKLASKNKRDAKIYEDWLKLYSNPNKNLIFDEIANIKTEIGKNYPFISLSLNNETKMFVANDIIHHNCMPCVMMQTIVEEMAEKFKGKIKFMKVNVDENKAISQKFKIMSIPCLIVFKNGKEAARITGSMLAEQLEEKLGALLK